MLPPNNVNLKDGVMRSARSPDVRAMSLHCMPLNLPLALINVIYYYAGDIAHVFGKRSLIMSYGILMTYIGLVINSI